MEQQRQLGEIIHWHKAKAFGHICGLGDGGSYFFHVTFIEIENGARQIPAPGDLFTFALKPSPKFPDRMDAVNLRLSKRANPAPVVDASAKVSHERD